MSTSALSAEPPSDRDRQLLDQVGVGLPVIPLSLLDIDSTNPNPDSAAGNTGNLNDSSTSNASAINIVQVGGFIGVLQRGDSAVLTEIGHALAEHDCVTFQLGLSECSIAKVVEEGVLAIPHMRPGQVQAIDGSWSSPLFIFPHLRRLPPRVWIHVDRRLDVTVRIHLARA